MKACAILLTLASLLGMPAHAADLRIHIDDVRSGAGQIMVALYDSEGRFMKQALHSASVAAVQGSTSVDFKDLPAGEYAFAVVHDANANGKMDRNLVGMPSEDYAFSNNALGKMGPAAYADARFSLPAGGAAVRVSLR
jgi:uncharacterized protein (DUF2141 family)